MASNDILTALADPNYFTAGRRVFGARANHLATLLRRAVNVLPGFTNADRPLATAVEANYMIRNLTSGQIQISDGAAWSDVGAGSSTMTKVARHATTAALPASTYNNGAGTITANANGALGAVDGVTGVLNEVILVQNQVAGLQNGLYRHSQIGTAGLPWILTRTEDMNESTDFVSGLRVLVQEGTVFADRFRVLTTNAPITLGTTALVFAAPILDEAELRAAGQALAAAMPFNGQDLTGIDEVELADGMAGATAAGRLRRNGTTLVYHDGTASREVYKAAGTDVAIADGGTGASTAGDARTALGLAIGTNVQAFDATLASLAALGTVADRLAYTTGVDTWAESPLTAFGRSLIDDVDAPTARTTLGLVIGTDVQAFDATLASIAALGTVADRLAYTTGVDTWAEAALTAAGRALIDDASATVQRATLGVTLRIPDLTAAAEAGNAIAVTIAIQDQDGSAVAAATRLHCQVFDAAMLEAVVGAFTCAETGVGTEVSTTARPGLLIDTDANGAATVTVTDVSGAFGGTVYLRVMPVIAEAGGAKFYGQPSIIPLVFAP